MKLLLISDLNMGGADSAEQAVPRSGYANISLELCRRLTTYGHEVKIFGVGDCWVGTKRAILNHSHQ